MSSGKAERLLRLDGDKEVRDSANKDSIITVLKMKGAGTTNKEGKGISAHNPQGDGQLSPTAAKKWIWLQQQWAWKSTFPESQKMRTQTILAQGNIEQKNTTIRTMSSCLICRNWDNKWVPFHTATFKIIHSVMETKTCSVVKSKVQICKLCNLAF